MCGSPWGFPPSCSNNRKIWWSSFCSHPILLFLCMSLINLFLTGRRSLNDHQLTPPMVILATIFLIIKEITFSMEVTSCLQLRMLLTLLLSWVSIWIYEIQYMELEPLCSFGKMVPYHTKLGLTKLSSVYWIADLGVTLLMLEEPPSMWVLDLPRTSSRHCWNRIMWDVFQLTAEHSN